jgi:flagellar hook assembly protein FlgD
VLQQLVAIPTALNHPEGNGVRVENLRYTAPGLHVAFWDGTDRDGRKVGSAVYFVQLEVNGRAAPPKRMVVTK